MCTYIYVYIHRYIDMYISISLSLTIYIYIYIYIHTHMWASCKLTADRRHGKAQCNQMSKQTAAHVRSAPQLSKPDTYWFQT